jgi:hypothetical protein
MKLLARLFATVSFNKPWERTYDLQLDHWGICRDENESFQDMRQRLESRTGPVWRWLQSNRTGFYDNSIKGVNDLHQKAEPTSLHTYYFSLSFHSTVPFPSDWAPWMIDALQSFPVPLVDFIRQLLDSIPLINIGAWIIRQILKEVVHVAGWRIISSVTSFRHVVRWATTDVANKLLREIDYNVVLPLPGAYLPRKNTLPLMLPTVYAIGGQDLTQEQKDILGPNLGDWYQNDGIVNTESMRGPDDSLVRAISGFPASNVNRDGVRGIYWHFGVNDQMDHADEIGIFIEEDTVSSASKLIIENHVLTQSRPRPRKRCISILQA